MFYLLLAVFSSAMVSICMRLGEGKGKQNIAMLAVNYLMCTILSACLVPWGSLPSGNLGPTIAMGTGNGLLYLVSFVLLQVNVRRNGVVLSSTFMKLGLLVTMVVSVCFYHEIPSIPQILGFGLAVAAILLINYRKDAGAALSRAALLWLLLCGGMADAMSKIFEESGVPGMEHQFLFFTFATALAFCGLCMVVKGQRAGKWEVFFGLLIGIPNYLSSKFLLRALEDVAAVIAYPVYSVSCILVVTLAGLLLFRERLEKRQWVALIVILAALVLLNI